MPQDAFTIRYIADELKEKLVGGKISRIIQPSRDNLTFIIYTRNGNLKLDAALSARSARLSLGEGERPVPQVAPNFCMLLRKHLQNAEVLDIVQPDFERIIYFDLKCVSDFSSTVMRLYFEIMGKYSNAVLTENGVIVGALKTSSIGENTKRVLFGGVKYVPPEPQDKLSPDDIQGLENALKNSGDKVEFLSGKVKGIAYATAVEMVETYGESITAQNIYDYIFKQKAEPCVTYTDAQPTDFKVRSQSQNQKRFNSLLEAQCAYYTCEYEKAAFREKKTKLESALGGAVKKAEKRLATINEKLLECRGAENIKLKGELITANIYAIERGAAYFKAVNYYDENCGEIKIELDRTLTPSQNAQKYYKKYAKLKRTQTAVTSQKEETEQRLDYLKSIAASISSAEKIADFAETEEELISLGLLKQPSAVKNKKPTQTGYRTYFYDGFKILSGRNNLQNDRLTKSLSQDDMWLHTQKYHSSHVAIITEGKKVPDSVLLVAAEICAYYSDGREGSKIPVDYTAKKYVKKPPQTNAGFAVYTDYSTILVNPNAHTELINE